MYSQKGGDLSKSVWSEVAGDLGFDGTSNKEIMERQRSWEVSEPETELCNLHPGSFTFCRSSHLKIWSFSERKEEMKVCMIASRRESNHFELTCSWPNSVTCKVILFNSMWHVRKRIVVLIIVYCVFFLFMQCILMMHLEQTLHITVCIKRIFCYRPLHWATLLGINLSVPSALNRNELSTSC